jgi:hypothetical protein
MKGGAGMEEKTRKKMIFYYFIKLIMEKNE